MKLSDNQGSGIMAALLMVLIVSLLSFPIFVFGQAAAQISHVKSISQNTLDAYTIKTGKEAVGSIKSGHDYVGLMNDKVFTNDFDNQLGTATRFKAYNSSGQRVFAIKDMDVRFIADKTLKSHVTYTLEYQFYFMSQPLFSKDIEIKLESRYNLK